MHAMLTFGMLAALVSARPAGPHGSAELARALDGLGVVGNVLYVAAHPDDENTKLLAYLANERLLRTAYLSLTRGDGGQNLIGSEQGALLGLIRTQELLAARRIDGAEQFFTRALDFGYSKTPAETLAIWGRDEVLADVVRVVRSFKPDVIITRFLPAGQETHGHHTASAILAEEAFKLAADPNYQPEQVKEFGTWQAKRLVWNKSMWGAKPDEDLSAFIALDIGGYNPALGLSYGELSADSRSMHKSQGFGSARTRGKSLEYFQLRAGAPLQQAIFDGVDQTWARVPNSDKLRAAIAKARGEFKAPVDAIPALLAVRAELTRLAKNPWSAQKLAAVDELIAGCAGLFLEATAEQPTGIPGGPLTIHATALNRSRAQLTLATVRFPGQEVAVGKPLVAEQPVELEQSVQLPADAADSNPYWLSEPPAKGLFTVRDPELIGLPENPPAVEVEFVLTSGKERIVLRRPLIHKWTDPVAGERTRSFAIQPAVTIDPSASVLMFPDAKPKTIGFRLRAGADGISCAVSPVVPAGWRVEPASAPCELPKKGAEQELSFRVYPPAAHPPSDQAPADGQPVLDAIVLWNGQRLQQGLKTIDYPHIPIQLLFPPARVKLVHFDMKRGGARLGYIPGPGDEVAPALRQVGYDVQILDDNALNTRDLHGLDAILVGVRAYNTNPRLPYHHKKLMDYVAAGGTLVAQYNTNNRISRAPAEIGPYPFEISQERVTDENAPVTFAEAKHALLEKPNKIGADDFAGWIQERGLYFADKWDARYETPLVMNDPGEPPRKGSLLVVRQGKGAFVYTGLSFFRQLPAGVPGAYRLLANLLAYGKR